MCSTKAPISRRSKRVFDHLSAFQQAKLWLTSHTGLSKDALHVYIGLLILFGAARLFRWAGGRLAPVAGGRRRGAGGRSLGHSRRYRHQRDASVRGELARHLEYLLLAGRGYAAGALFQPVSCQGINRIGDRYRRVRGRNRTGSWRRCRPLRSHFATRTLLPSGVAGGTCTRWHRNHKPTAHYIAFGHT